MNWIYIIALIIATAIAVTTTTIAPRETSLKSPHYSSAPKADSPIFEHFRPKFASCRRRILLYMLSVCEESCKRNLTEEECRTIKNDEEMKELCCPDGFDDSDNSQLEIFIPRKGDQKPDRIVNEGKLGYTYSK
uniref:INSulin related n=1 Tax=Caenorhabditis tropicalis TaxID=1561998 RepID=A0A1I7V1P9_9PELO